MTTTTLALTAIPATYWAYWITTKSDLPHALQDLWRKDLTPKGFATEAWACCVCRTHWTTAAALLLAAPWSWATLLTWTGINGAHAAIHEHRTITPDDTNNMVQ